MEEDPEKDAEQDMEIGEDQIAQNVQDVALGGSISSFDLSEGPGSESDVDYNPAADHQAQVGLEVDLLDSYF